jgi:predicted small secreted protein
MDATSTRRRATARTAPLAALLLSCLLLAGCSVGTSTGNDAQSGGGAVPEPGVQAPEGGDESADRQVVSAATISLTSSDPLSVAYEAVEVALEADGHVDSRTDTPIEDSRQGSAQLVLRVPSENLDETLVELKTLGDLVRSSLNQTDVTTQAADLDARIAALETGVNRLLTLMSQATTTADLIDLESALSQRQTELDGLTAQRDSLLDRVEYAAVEMYISTPGEVAGAVPGDFWGGVVVGFQAMMTFFGGLLVVLGVLLPWLLPLGLLAVLIAWLVRRKRRTPPGSPGYPHEVVPPRPPLPTETGTAESVRVPNADPADRNPA